MMRSASVALLGVLAAFLGRPAPAQAADPLCYWAVIADKGRSCFACIDEAMAQYEIRRCTRCYSYDLFLNTDHRMCDYRGAAAPGAATPMAATSWTVTEGVCFDWRGTWDLNPTGAGTWSGRINYRHVGGNCAVASGGAFTANVAVQVTGTTWRAQRTNSAGGNDCSYAGTVRGTQLVGTYTCVKNGGPFNIVINLPGPLATAPSATGPATTPGAAALPAPAAPGARPPPAPVAPHPSAGAPAPAPGVATCPLAGTWTNQVAGLGNSTWTISPDGTAVESGIGNARGRASIAGHTLTIQYSAGGTTGDYIVTLNLTCAAGTGQTRWLSGPSAGRSFAVTFARSGGAAAPAPAAQRPPAAPHQSGGALIDPPR